MLPSFYHSILEKYLNPQQLLTLQMLVWLLQSPKQVRIERLAATLPLTILQNSRRLHIQRFLSIKALSILVIWFPIIREVISSPVAPDLYNGGVINQRVRSNHYGQTSGH